MLTPANERLSEKARTKGLPYRPGENLFAKRSLVTEGEYYYWDDGEVRVSGREFNAVIQSPCFLHDGADEMKMDCFSCHEMHRADDDPRPLDEWRDDQLKPGMRGDLACVQCHEDFQDTQRITQHTNHPLDSAGSSCMNCHMPNTCWALLKTSRSHQIVSPTVRSSTEFGRPNACNLCHLDRSVAWAAEKLEEWYEIPQPEMKREHRELASGVLWTLTGDAGQRALMAWHMGWEPTQEAAGTDWLAPFLAQLLQDPYDAVRFAANRSLRTLSGYEDFEYDFVADPELRAQASTLASESWPGVGTDVDPDRAAKLLLRPDGFLRMDAVNKLLEFRNNRPVVLAE